MTPRVVPPTGVSRTPREIAESRARWAAGLLGMASDPQCDPQTAAVLTATAAVSLDDAAHLLLGGPTGGASS